MRFLIALFCVIFCAYGYDPDSAEHGVASTGVSPNCSCGWANKEGERIVNGERAGKFEYPMMAGMVRFKSSTDIYCGATIITDKHLLTAAHCTKKRSPSDFGIHVGKNVYEKKIIDGILNLFGTVGTSLYKIKSFTEHPQYDAAWSVYDIAIITISNKFVFGPTLGPACLPSKRLNLVGENLKITGWGRQWYSGPSSDYLLKTYVQVKPHEECKTYNFEYEMENTHQICTFTKGTDSCQGDSGGPLFWLNPSTNRYTIVALVSYGRDCAKYPAVNTEVAYFLPWIQYIISENGPSSSTCSHNELK